MGRYIPLSYTYWLRTSIISEPYEAYAPDPLVGWAYDPSAEARALLGEARQRIAELSSRPSWANPSPAADWVLRRLEVVASSAVEGINTTLRSLTAHESPRTVSDHRNADADAAAVGAWKQNRLALEMGALSETTAPDLLRLHRELLRQTGQDKIAGWVRTEQNWVGAPEDRTPRSAVFVPPPPDMLPDLLEDLAAYMSSPGADPLTSAAVAHAQFVTVHPFDDGNGRTGRAISHLMLRRGGAAGDTPIPMSAALEPVRAAYFGAMNSTRHEGPPDDPGRSEAMDRWTALFAESAIVACAAAEHAVDSIGEMLERWAGLRFRQRSAAQRALGVLETMPVIEAPDLADRLGVSEPAARRGLRQLEDAGVLVQATTPHNGNRFETPDMLDLVDRRKARMAEMWDFRRAGLRRPPSSGGQRVGPQERPGRQTAAPCRCPHTGPVAKQQCRLAAGHRGHHRYR